MKPIIETHNNVKKIDYRATALALLEVLDLSIDDLIDQSHNDNYYFLVGAKFNEENLEILPVSEQVTDTNTTFAEAEVLARIGSGAYCNCEVCKAFSSQNDHETFGAEYPDFATRELFTDFYEVNFPDAHAEQHEEILDSLEDALRGFLGENTDGDLLINREGFGDTYVGTPSQWEKFLRTAFMDHYKKLYQESLGEDWDYENSEDEYAEDEYADEAIDNDLDSLSCATREDLLLFPRLDEDDAT